MCTCLIIRLRSGRAIDAIPNNFDIIVGTFCDAASESAPIIVNKVNHDIEAREHENRPVIMDVLDVISLRHF